MFAEENLNDQAGAEDKDPDKDKNGAGGENKDTDENKDGAVDGKLLAWDVGEGENKRTVTTEDILTADERNQEVARLKAENQDLTQRHAKLVSSVGFQQSEAGKVNKQVAKPDAVVEDPFKDVDMEDSEEVKQAMIKVYDDNKKLREEIPGMVNQQALKDRAMQTISDDPVLKTMSEKAAIGTYDSAMEYGNEQNNLAQQRGESPPFPNPKSAIEGYMKFIASGLNPKEEKKPEKDVKVAQKIFKDVTTGSEETVPGGGGGEVGGELVEKWETMSTEEQDEVIRKMPEKKQAQFQKTLNAYLDKK